MYYRRCCARHDPLARSGAATALENAVILSALFARIDSPNQLESAFQAYDAVRRPRSQRIAESSRATGRILSRIAEGIGLDLVKMRAALKDHWTFIHEFDLDKHVESALNILND